MKKGISTPTILVTITLTVIFIFIMAIFIGQQKAKTEKTIFKTLWDKFFPNKIESVVIPGTVVGSGASSCPKIIIDGADMLARAMIDCWVQGEGDSDRGIKGLNIEIPCCYRINSSKLTSSITQDQVKASLEGQGKIGKYIATATASDFVWKVGTVLPNDYEFKVCYDQDGWNEISVTRGTSTTDCDD